MMQWVKYIAVTILTVGVSIFVIRKVGFLNNLVFGAQSFPYRECHIQQFLKDEKTMSEEATVTVYQGGHPKYTGSQVNAEAYASRLRGDALHQGTNIEVPEHKIEVR